MRSTRRDLGRCGLPTPASAKTAPDPLCLADLNVLGSYCDGPAWNRGGPDHAIRAAPRVVVRQDWPLACLKSLAIAV